MRNNECKRGRAGFYAAKPWRSAFSRLLATSSLRCCWWDLDIFFLCSLFCLQLAAMQRLRNESEREWDPRSAFIPSPFLRPPFFLLLSQRNDVLHVFMAFLQGSPGDRFFPIFFYWEREKRRNVANFAVWKRPQRGPLSSLVFPHICTALVFGNVFPMYTLRRDGNSLLSFLCPLWGQYNA